jgi:hypothetical protein
MADIATGQRVRLWDGTKDIGFASTDPLYTRIHDTNNELNPVPFDGPAAGTEGGVAAMAQRHDAGGSLVSATGDWSPLQVDGSGNLRVTVTGGGGNSSVKTDGSVFTLNTDEVTPMGALADDTAPGSVDEGDVGIPRMTLDRKMLQVIVDPDTDGNRWAIDGAGLGQVDLAAVSVTAVPVSATAAVNDETNPIYVQVVSGATSGNEVHDFDQAAATGAGASTNHDYVTAGATFFLKSVIIGASGEARFELQIGPAAGLVTKGVFFTTSSNPTKQLDFDPPMEIPVAASGTTRIVKQNDDNQAQDVYSTIIGYDV